MNRYIDADKLKEECYKFTNDVSRSAMAFVQGQINAAPTADVVEVRHGEWITKCIAISSSGFEWYMHTCSNCGDFYKTVLPNGYKYCHNCGAKMDGGRSEK